MGTGVGFSVAVLKVVPSGGGAARRVEVGSGPVTIGRGMANAIVLRDDPRASLRHAMVERTPGGAHLLRDEGSTNGTWVNGTRVRQHLLRGGDQVQVGDTVILFEG